ncbi:MAG: DUF551 domain-containing protein [Clostridiaceae bacterium]|nr:DUF551 domain-containing protein [Clostridiaceae bacterium]
MKTSDLIEALNRLKVQTGSLACLGCGREHNCSTQGCRLIREAVEKLCGMEWIDTKVELPPDDVTVLAIVSGEPYENITLVSVPCTGAYSESEGWMIDEFPMWENPQVSHWMPIPKLPEES